MADKRIQQYPEKNAPSSADYLLIADNQDVDVNGFLKYKKIKISSLDNIVITNAEDILLQDLRDLLSNNDAVVGRFYRITDSSFGDTILVQAVSNSFLSEIGVAGSDGSVYSYDINTDIISSFPSISDFVPYQGAVDNLNLGDYSLIADRIILDETPIGNIGERTMMWNDTDGTFDIGMKGGDVVLQVGQEQLARVVNKTNTNLTQAGYGVVRISGAQGQRLKVDFAQADDKATCEDTIGVVTENITNNQEGFITTSGLVRDINTTGSLQGETWVDGDRLYLSPTVAGGLTKVEPSAPNIVIVVGYVVYAHANNGSIYVSVQGAKGLHELFDVSIPNPTNNNVLVYESSTGLWKDKSLGTVIGGTPSQFLKGDGSLDSNIYLTTISGISAGGELSGTYPNPSLSNNAVTGKVLTGLSVSGSTILSTDSILTALGKAQNQINALAGGVNYQGTWDASTNTPSLSSGVGTKGYYYVVSVAGSTNLNGITDWKLGDWAIYDGTAWQKVDNTDAVISVNGYTGIVTLSAADVGALPTSAISGTPSVVPIFTGSGTIGDSTIIKSSNTYIYGDTTTGNNIRLVSSSYGNNGIFELYGTDNALKLQLGTSSATEAYIFSNTGVSLNFYTNATSRMFIQADGSIITNAAADTGEHFIVGGSARVNGDTEINSGELFVRASTTEGSGYQLNALTFGYNVAGAYGWITAGGASSRTALTLNAGGGNVLVGTTTDNGVDRLQVNGSGVFSSTLQSGHITSTAGLTLASSNNISWGGLYGANIPTLTATLAGGFQFYPTGSTGGLLATITTTGGALFSDKVVTKSLDGFQLLSGSDTLFSLKYSGGTLLDRLASTSFFIAENGSPQLTIVSGGAATFSSSINAALGKFGGTGNNAVLEAQANSGEVFRADAGGGAARIIADQTGVTLQGALSFLGAATFSSSVTAAGSVGIGGTNTDSLLTINGTAGTSHERFREGSTTIGFVGGANGIISGHNGKMAVRAEAGLVLSGQGNAADFVIKSNGVINISSLPTSASGLSTGDLWNNGGVVSIV